MRKEGLPVGPIRSMAPTTRSAASAILTSAHNAIMRSDYAALSAALSRLTAATALQEQFPSTEKGDTLLTSACRRGDARAVALVLAQGAGIIRIEDAPNAIGANAMHIACNLGHAEVTELLLAYRADVNAAWQGGSGCTPVHFAARQGAIDCLKLLTTDPDLDVDALTHRNLTALHMAVNKGFTECVALLIEARANVDLEGPGRMGAMHGAASRGHTACVRVLLEAGAAVDALCHGAPAVRTPLHLACERGHVGTCKLLSAYGARRDFAHDYVLPSGAEVVAFRNGHHGLASWLRLTKHWTPLHHLEEMSEARCRALLRGDEGTLARPLQGVGADPHARLPIAVLPNASVDGAAGASPSGAHAGVGTAHNVAQAADASGGGGAGVQGVAVGVAVGAAVVAAVAAAAAGGGGAGAAAAAAAAAVPAVPAPPGGGGPLAAVLSVAIPAVAPPLAVTAYERAARVQPPTPVSTMVLLAGRDWCPHNHHLFPAAARARAVELLLVGHLLAAQPRFHGESHSLLDAWVTFVMAHAVTRDLRPAPRG